MRMRKRCAAVTVLAAAALVLAWYAWDSDDPVRDNCLHVEPGWTRADVVRVMGREPDQTNLGDVQGIVLYYRGRNGNAVVFLSRDTQLVVDAFWIEDNPLWSRTWRQLKTALGI